MTGREVFPIIDCSDPVSTCACYERVFSAEEIYRFPEGTMLLVIQVPA